MKSDLTCPVEITKVTVNRETEETKENEQIVCLIEFFNLSEKVIDSLQMNIICFAEDGTRIGGRLVRASAPAGGREHFSGTFMPEHVDGAVRVEAAVEKVWFQDGVLWRREERNVREYTPNALPEGRELDRLRAVAGPDAAGYAREDDIVWMCVCGRANRTSDDTCIRCERERTQVLADYSFAAIDATVGQKERDLEKKTQESLRRSSETTVKEQNAIIKQSKKKRRAVKTVIVLLVLAVIALAMYRWGVPMAACYLGEQKHAQGLYADARDVFAWVETYWPGMFGAGVRADEAEEAIIEGLIGVGSDVAYEEAAARAKALDTQAAKLLYDEAVIGRAKLAIENGDGLKGEELLLSLPHNAQAGEFLAQLIYDMAGAAREKLDYDTAIARYTQLGGYEDAGALLLECYYDYGRHLMREEQYEAACEQLMKVSDRGDAITLIRQCRYETAKAAQEKGDYVAAAEIYETLGIYEEAETRAKLCRYTAGMAALSAGELEAAAQHLRLALDYEDAQQRFADAAYTLGMAALENGEFENAIAWLEQLPREGDALDALNTASYAYADSLEKAGYAEAAALEFAALGGYQDAEERAAALEYSIALEEMKSSPESALLRLEGLGKYKDAADQAQQCRYIIACMRYDDGQYEDALARFEALGSYEDAKLQVRRSRYALAGQRVSEEKYSEAAALFEACGAYLDAEERAMRAQYDHAAALETAGEHQAAAAAFAQLGSYEDAKRRVTANEDAWLQAAYNSARMDMELGDYASVIAALENDWNSELPERYAAMEQMYVDACLGRAQALTEQGKPMDALPLLESIQHNKTAKKRLEAYVYRIVGKWKDARGVEYIFRRDGSCCIAGKEGYYGGSGYDLTFGEEPYPTQKAYSVVNLRGKTLSLKNLETKSTVRLSYAGEETPPVQETESAEAEVSDAADAL